MSIINITFPYLSFGENKCKIAIQVNQTINFFNQFEYKRCHVYKYLMEINELIE